MAMILELTEDFVLQEHFVSGKWHGPTFLHQGLRGIVEDASYSFDFPGIDDGTEVAVIQIINNDAEFELVTVPLSKVKIIYDHKVMYERKPSSIPGE